MINKKLLIATSVTALFLAGCLDSATGESQRAANDDTSMLKVEKSVPKKAEASEKSATAQKSSGGADTTACVGCHGASFEKKAMDVSKIVKDLSKDDIVKALKGYKDGSYGGGMKSLMAGQVASLDDASIDAIASKITGGGEAKAEAPAKEEAPAESKVEEKAPATEEAPAEAKAEEKAPAKEEAPTEAKTEEKAPAVEVNISACVGCHGASFEKKAMNVSKIVKDLTKDEILTALKGYKDGSYGGAMKTLMKGQVAGLSDADMEAIATKFGK